MEKKNYLVAESTWGSPNMKGTCVYYDEFSSEKAAYDYADKQEKEFARDAKEHPNHCWEVTVYSPDEWEYDDDSGEYIILA